MKHGVRCADADNMKACDSRNTDKDNKNEHTHFVVSPGRSSQVP